MRLIMKNYRKMRSVTPNPLIEIYL